MGRPQMQLSKQGFPPVMAGAVPASAVTSGETLPNGGYMSRQQQQVPGPVAQGQAPHSVHQGQWSMNQVTQGKLFILRKLHLL